MAVSELPNAAAAGREPGGPCPRADARPEATCQRLPPPPAAGSRPAGTRTPRAGSAPRPSALARQEPAGTRAEPGPQPCPGEEAPGASRGEAAAQSRPGAFPSTQREERQHKTGGGEQGGTGASRGTEDEGAGGERPALPLCRVLPAVTSCQGRAEPVVSPSCPPLRCFRKMVRPKQNVSKLLGHFTRCTAVCDRCLRFRMITLIGARCLRFRMIALIGA